ncbi:MAG TPA: S1C family serine protease [Terracidiphilus sp.]
MKALVQSSLVFLCAFGFCAASLPQVPASSSAAPQPEALQSQLAEKATPSVAMVLAVESAGSVPSTVGTALAIRQDGILLTAYHVVRNAYALQVRLKSGEVFDQAQLLGVDLRRDVAAIRISASGLPILPVAPAGLVRAGDPVMAIAHPESLPWSVSSGMVAAYRIADEVPGAGSGYRLIQFTAASSSGSSGGVLIDGQGRALGLIVGSLNQGQNLNFAVPIESVMGLADGAVSKSFANGSALTLPCAPAASTTAAPKPVASELTKTAAPEESEKSDLLKNSKDPEFILRNFKTMYVDCEKLWIFKSDRMKAALFRNPDFAALTIRVVDDPALADTVLVVGYTFAWDYPFELIHQNTSTVLLAGKGSGALSGPAGAASVAAQFVKLMQPYRSPRPAQK